MQVTRECVGINIRTKCLVSRFEPSAGRKLPD
ncbi:MAG: hypothetical protein JWM37_927, partial [Candidatus Saccharibacteria bacterium]|nr:hypothetical protein [Candidatus Saccharibacteria bacterium]